MDESAKSRDAGRRHAVGTGMASVGQVKDVMRVTPKGQLMGVENFVTHNGKSVNVKRGWGDVGRA